MNDTNTWKIRPGGLFRCCTDTAAQHNKPGATEGERLQCQHCDDAMVWREEGRYWEWQHAGRWEANHHAPRGAES